MIVFFIYLVLLSKETQFWVSVQSGNDSFPGTKSQPFKTIAKAKLSLRSFNGQENSVFLFPGVYTETIEFSPEDSGSNGFYNVYTCEQCDQGTTLFGGKVLSDWTFDSSTNTYKTFVGVGTKSRDLFVNNRRATRARGTLPKGSSVTADGYQLPSGYESWSTWGDVSSLEFVANKVWVQRRCSVSSISSSGAITMQQPCWKEVSAAGAAQMGIPTWIENAKELLSSEDEWYLDSSSGYLYYHPLSSEPIAQSRIILSLNERFIYGVGTKNHPVHHIKIHGLTFMDTTWMGPSEGGKGFPEVQANVLSDGTSPTGAIEFQYGTNIIIEDNYITQTGNMGILLGTGTQHCVISSNTVIDTASIGIKVGDQDGIRLNQGDQARNNYIFNNKIRYTGKTYAGAPAMMIGFCYNCTVSHNDIQYATYTGISHSWGWTGVISNFEGMNLICNNLVNQTMMELFDGGDFYSLGTQPINGSVCAENVFVGSQNCYGSLYLDDGSRYWTVYHNIVFGNVGLTALIKGGEHNIHDNYWQNRGKNKVCSDKPDIDFMNNGKNCAPCTSSGCTECGPITLLNNKEIQSLDEAPQSIIQNAGLVKNGKSHFLQQKRFNELKLQ